MGYYTRYFSTIFRGARATSFKERMEARRAVRRLRLGDKFYKSAITLLEQHRVTSALNALKKAMENLGVSSNKADAFIYNVLTQDNNLVKAEKDILRSLFELLDAAKNNTTLRKLGKDLALTILEWTKNYKFAEPGEREEYKQVMLVLNLAEASKNTFMAKLKLMFQKQDTVSMLSRFPMVRGARIEKDDILKLRQIANDIKGLKARFKPNLEKEAEMLLAQDVGKVAADLKEAFYNTYMIKKRDILIILKILYDSHNMKQLILGSVQKHYLPQKPSQELVSEIEKTEKTVFDNFQPVAQGFRIVIAAIERLEKEAERDVGILAKAA